MDTRDGHPDDRSESGHELAFSVGDDHLPEREDIAASGKRRPVQRLAGGRASDPQVANDFGERADNIRTSPIGPANAQRFIEGAMPLFRKRSNPVTARRCCPDPSVRPSNAP